MIIIKELQERHIKKCKFKVTKHLKSEKGTVRIKVIGREEWENYHKNLRYNQNVDKAEENNISTYNKFMDSKTMQEL